MEFSQPPFQCLTTLPVTPTSSSEVFLLWFFFTLIKAKHTWARGENPDVSVLKEIVYCRNFQTISPPASLIYHFCCQRSVPSLLPPTLKNGTNHFTVLWPTYPVLQQRSGDTRYTAAFLNCRCSCGALTPWVQEKSQHRPFLH